MATLSFSGFHVNQIPQMKSNLKIKAKKLNFKFYYNVSVPIRVLQGVPFYLKAPASSKYKSR